MNIKECLLQEMGTRLSNSNGRWLVIDELYVPGGEFVVYEQKYYARKVTEVYRGSDEEEAVKQLLNKKEEE